MSLRKALLIVTMLLSSPCLADDPPKQLTNRDCERVLAGLNALDGHQVVLNAGKPTERVALIPYEFGNAQLRATILKNVVALEAAQKIANENKSKTFAEYAKGEVEVPVNSRVEYSAKITDIDDLPCGADLKRITIDSLKLDKNEIPGSVLVAIDKILDK